MDIKNKIDIKDEPTEDETLFSHHLDQSSNLEEIQEKSYYPYIHIKNEIEVKDEPCDIEDKNTSNFSQHFETISGLDGSQSSVDSKIRLFEPDSFENDEKLFQKIFIKSEMKELDIEYVNDEEYVFNDVIKSENRMMVDKNLSNEHIKKFMSLKNVSSLLNKVREKCSEVHFESEEEEFFAKLVTSEFPQVLLKRWSHEEFKAFTSYAAEGEENICKNTRPRRKIPRRQWINKNFNCKYCDFSFNSKDELTTHLISHSIMFKCDYCQYESKSEYNMKRHRLNHNDIKLFKCSECIYECNRKDVLISHMIVHGVKPYTCHLCNGKFNYKKSLKIHLLRHGNSTVTMTKNFKCSVCTYECNDKRNLNRHMLVHANFKLFKCTDCSYETNYKTHLKRHMVRHENVKLFKCSDCNYECNYKVSLDNHMLNHKNIKLFSCSQCSYKTNYKFNLKQHMLKHPNSHTEEKLGERIKEKK